jgi:PD-(D/E)XK endonuclease
MGKQLQLRKRRIMEAPFKRGNISEALVLARYLKAGFMVSTPFGVGAPYDMIVDTGAALLRVQVKTGRLRDGTIEFETRRARSRIVRNGYEENEVDYFVICCSSVEEIYALKAEGGVCGRLRLKPTGNSQQMFVRWAEDYLFEKHVEELKALVPPVAVLEEKEWVV